MARANFFFKREEFLAENLAKPFYNYLGYFFSDNSDPSRTYPISLYFGKYEIAIYYTSPKDKKIRKVFSLYVAEGNINQSMLAKKVKDYALMPMWPISDGLNEELRKLQVEPWLLKLGFFTAYYGFEFQENTFHRTNLADSKSKQVEITNNGKIVKITFKPLKKNKRTQQSEKKAYDELKIIKADDGTARIRTQKISFLKILLDFLFELEFANTFEDDNFFHLQPHLQNNLVLDALSKKCRYLAELDKLRLFSQKTKTVVLPKQFLDAEKAWLNICRLEDYKPVFATSNSLFDDPEIEVENIIFKAKIGVGRKPRKAYLGNREGAELKNEICTFFMRKYHIWNAVKTVLSPTAIALFTFTLFFIPFGDFFLGQGSAAVTGGGWYPVGFSSIVVPLVMLTCIPLYQYYRGINLFKLILPRLMLGIMVGWAIFWGTEELWKKALTANACEVFLFDGCLITLLFLYIFTDIGNQTYRSAGKHSSFRIALKTISLIGMSLIVSFVMGFYVIQFYAAPMLENSDFLTHELLYKKKNKPAENAPYPTLQEFFEKTIFEETIQEKMKFFIKFKKWEWRNYASRKLQLPFLNRPLIYIWSILFSQFVVSILMGAVLQLIWEDRPITEPL